MSTDRLSQNFQKFIQSIYYWPTPTIEKNIILQKLEDLCRENSELQHIYENIPLLGIIESTANHNNIDLSRLDSNESNRNSLAQQKLDPNSLQSSISENQIPTKANMILVKEGDLKVRKGSAVLSPLIKKNGFKSSVYCELAYEIFEGEKIIYLFIFQSRKNRKMIYQFTIDDTCSLIYENKREFLFKHNFIIEKFTTETGTADPWISALYEVSMRRGTIEKDEDIYENPDEPSSTSGSSFEYIPNTPHRPPPRPPQPTNSISPANIYVCLYDHSSNNDPHELEFKCGDLLYIINTDGPDFYIGHRLILPLNDYSQIRKGLVYKSYITQAYERILS